MTSAPLPRILRRRGGPEYPTFLELFFDLVYIFLLSRLSASLGKDLTVRNVAQTAVLPLALRRRVLRHPPGP
jgi:low temperature requirement protein LtrA